MAIGANSYGTVKGVAGLVPKHSGAGGGFTAVTRPTNTQVEGYIDQLSGMVNIMLAEAGFDIPITQADAVLALDLFVNQETAAIVEGVNGYGRFGPTQGKGTPRGRFALMLDDVKSFIEANMAGFERMGATRDYSATAGLGFRETDESGNTVHPIFQRSAHGNTFTNWDAD